MAVRPNLVVGAAGVAVVLMVGSVLAANWESLAEVDRFTVDVQEEDHGTQMGARTAAGSTATRTVPVEQENVTRLGGQLTWQDNTPADADAEVTLRVFRPDGRQVAESTGTSGVRGITFDVLLSQTPQERSYRDTLTTAQAKFARDYPPSDLGTGDWRFEVEVVYPGQSPLGSGDINWRLVLDWENWRASLERAPTIGFQGK